MVTAQQRERYQAMSDSPDPFVASLLDPDEKFLAIGADYRKRFVAAGGRLLIGTDPPNAGMVHGYATQAAMIQRADIFPLLDVIKMTTSDAAEFLGIDDSTGRIAIGLEADLLIVREAPDRDMRDIQNVAYVFKDGLAYDPEKLREASRGMVGLP